MAFRTLSNIRYKGSSPKTSLDLFLPTNKKSDALIVFVHGGAWVDRDKDQYAFVGKTFASLGYSTAVVDYTLSPKEISSSSSSLIHPVHVSDVADSIVWLRKHSDEHGYNPNKIFFLGHSAGGFMAGQLCLQSEYLGEHLGSIVGWISLQGIFDLNQLESDYPTYKEHFIDFAFGQDKEQWKKASPQHANPTTYFKEPWLILHSPQDELVNLTQSSNFGFRLQELNIPYKLVAEQDGKHFEVVNKLGQKDSAVTSCVLRFIEEVSQENK